MSNEQVRSDLSNQTTKTTSEPMPVQGDSEPEPSQFQLTSPQKLSPSQVEGQKAHQEAYEKSLSELKNEAVVLASWTKLTNYFIEQKLSRSTAFAAIDTKKQGTISESDFSTYVSGLPIEGVKTQGEQIFKLIQSSSEGGEVNQQAWSDFWLQSPQLQYEIEHKIQLLNQKQNIFEALDSQPGSGQKVDDSKVSNKYQSMIDKIKHSSSLTDITSMFSQLGTGQGSPFKRKEVPYQSSLQQPIVFELRKEKIEKYRTPRREEEESMNGRPSFLPKDTLLPQKGSPQGTFIAKSPISGFAKHTVKPEVSTKVERQRNINVESSQPEKAAIKITRRKEDLNTYMSKLGLGKYDAPRVTVDLGQVEKKGLRTMDFNLLKNTGPIVQKDSRRGLNDLVNDPTFNQGTFRRVKAEQRANSRSVSTGRETFTLVDQSLKNYTMKLIHQHKYAPNQQQLKSPNRKISGPGSFLRNT